MSRDLSDDLLSAINGPETDETLIALVTIEPPDDYVAPAGAAYDGSTIRISSHNTERYDDTGPRYRTMSRGHAYEFFPFKITLPEEGDDQQPTIQMVLDNVVQEVTALVRSVTTPATVTVEFVLLSDPGTVEWELPEFALTSADASAGQVILTLSVDALLDAAYPGYDFTPSAFPGLWEAT